MLDHVDQQCYVGHAVQLTLRRRALPHVEALIPRSATARAPGSMPCFVQRLLELDSNVPVPHPMSHKSRPDRRASSRFSSRGRSGSVGSSAPNRHRAVADKFRPARPGRVRVDRDQRAAARAAAAAFQPAAKRRERAGREHGVVHLEGPDPTIAEGDHGARQATLVRKGASFAGAVDLAQSGALQTWDAPCHGRRPPTTSPQHAAILLRRKHLRRAARRRRAGR